MLINTIYLADYEQMFLDCLYEVLKVKNFDVVGASIDGSVALKEIKLLAPDLVITELNLDNLSGINLIRKLKALGSEVKVILLCSSLTPLAIHKALSAGADGILLKNDQFSLLYEAISVINKKKFLSPSISDPLVNNFLSLSSSTNSEKISPLTDREEQVAKLISDGDSSKEIANILSISEKTVSKHRNNIFKKLRIKNTAQLVRYVFENDLIG